MILPLFSLIYSGYSITNLCTVLGWINSVNKKLGLHGLHFLGFKYIYYIEYQLFIIFFYQKNGLQCKP